MDKYLKTLLGILILGLVLRAYHMDYPFTGYQSLKEVQFAGMAEKFLADGNYFMPRDYFQGPNNNVFLPAWFVVAAWNLFGKTEFAARIPFVIMGVLSIYVMYLLGKELYDRRVGLLAAFFTAVSPMVVYFGRNVQGEGPIVLGSAASIYFFLRLQKTGKTNYLFLCALSILLAVMSKFTSLYLLFPIFVYYYFNRKDYKIKPINALAALGIVIVPTILYILYANTFPEEAYSANSTITTLSDLVNVRAIFFRVVYLVGGTNPFIILLSLPFIYSLLKTRKASSGDMMLVYWFMGYTLTYAAFLKIATVGNNYYLISFIPPIILASAKSAFVVLKNRKLFYGFMAATLITSVVGLAVIYDSQHPEDAAGEKIASIIGKDDTLYRIGNTPTCYYAHHFCDNEVFYDWMAGNYTYLSLSGRFYDEMILPYPEKKSYLEQNFNLLYNITGKQNLLKGNNFEFKQTPEYELVYKRKIGE